MRKTLLFLSVLTQGLIPGPIPASENPADSSSIRYRMNPIVVTATKMPVVPQNLASSVSVVSSADLEMLPTSAVFDAVQTRVPGLYTTEWGVMGFGAAGSAAGKISMRGAGGGANSCVLVLRDGRPDFMGLMGCTIADEFSTDGVERLEVIRGPGSFLYGTNAIGGVINIIPWRMKTAGFDGRLTIGAGSFDSRTASLRHGGKIGAFDYAVTAANRATAGHRKDADSDYRAGHYTVHLGWQAGPDTELEFNANLADIRVLDPGTVSSPVRDHRYDMLRSGGNVNVVHRGRFGETNVKVHANFGKHDFYDGWKSDDRTAGVMMYQNIAPWKGNTTTFGFDWKEYGGDAEDAATDYREIFITEYAPYAHIQQILLSRFIVSGGLRVENHELYGSEILPKAGLVFHPFDRTALRLSVSKGFRSPSIRELYFWMPANAGLTPDRLWNTEAGLSQKIGPSMTLDATVYRAEGSNLIQQQSPPPKWVNTGAYTHRGVELAWNWTPSPALETGATWSENDLSEKAFNSPGRKITAFVNVNAGAVVFSADLLSVADWKGLTTVNRKDVYPDMRDYTVLNLSAGTAAWRGIAVKLRVRNALDESYEAMFGYPMPGRNWVAEAEYSL
ncbi:MAG: TonB-dependent receptor [bacterium]|nr:TonB-dependent receptor [bacterium]